MQRTINEKELTIRAEQVTAKKAMNMIDELRDAAADNKELKKDVEMKAMRI